MNTTASDLRTKSSSSGFPFLAVGEIAAVDQHLDVVPLKRRDEDVRESEVGARI